VFCVLALVRSSVDPVFNSLVTVVEEPIQALCRWLYTKFSSYEEANVPVIIEVLFVA
jgi:hypothetical protein